MEGGREGGSARGNTSIAFLHSCKLAVVRSYRTAGNACYFGKHGKARPEETTDEKSKYSHAARTLDCRHHALMAIISFEQPQPPSMYTFGRSPGEQNTTS